MVKVVPTTDLMLRSSLLNRVLTLGCQTASVGHLGAESGNLGRRNWPFTTTWRPDPKRLIYPNAVVAEKVLGIPGTTRSWNTIEAACKILVA